MATVWGLHMEWDDGRTSSEIKDIAIGWHELGNLQKIPASREAYKAAFAKTFPSEKPGAIPVKAGVLFRFLNEMKVGDTVVYPSKFDRTVNIGTVASEYVFSPVPNPEHPHRRRVDWKCHIPRAQFSQPALYEIGSAITLFQVTNNDEEFLAALRGVPLPAAEVDSVNAVNIAVQAEENVEDFVIKTLKNNISPKQFEEFVAEVLRSMGYHTRLTAYSGDGGVDIIAHKDELGFEPPIIKVQCKQVLSTVGGPTVQQLLGAVQRGEHALFVTLGDFSGDAMRIERTASNLRLIAGTDLVRLVFNNYERLEPQFKSMLPLKRSYTPSVV